MTMKLRDDYFAATTEARTAFALSTTADGTADIELFVRYMHLAISPYEEFNFNVDRAVSDTEDTEKMCHAINKRDYTLTPGRADLVVLDVSVISTIEYILRRRFHGSARTIAHMASKAALAQAEEARCRLTEKRERTQEKANKYTRRRIALFVEAVNNAALNQE